MKRITTFLPTLLLLASCATIPNSAQDRAGAVRAALRDLGGGERITTLVVGGPNSYGELRAALQGKIAVISDAEVPKSERETLPAGYAKLQMIDITGNHGTLKLLVGPVPKAAEGEILMACGTTYTFALDRTEGGWKATVTGVAVC
ncbi:MAG: hypothetical protein QOI24_4195 [Acidobacteriota bacterium]|jgi:hypothetical protein|nr:hypothetical protein [Acidobacteriota bacterium]